MMMEGYNPDRQKYLCQDKDDCILGDHPTLAALKLYGNRTPIAWLVPQLLNLSEFCGCKDKLTNTMIEELADIIAAEWFYLKVSELMLFFHWFKSGKYGRFYGAVDPLVITTSLRDFVMERNDRLSRLEQDERESRMQEHMSKAVTREQYEQMKKEGMA